MSKTYISYNNNTEKLLTNQQKNCPISNQVAYPFFIQINLLIF